MRARYADGISGFAFRSLRLRRHARRSKPGATMFETRKILASLARIEAKLGIIQKEEETNTMDITQITTDVTAQTTVSTPWARPRVERAIL